MYNSPYYVPMTNGIDLQMQELQRQRGQVQQLASQLSGQPSINQTFQIGTSNLDFLKYANDIEDVKKNYVYGDTPFFSKDLSVMWLKNAKGEIRIFELSEVVEKDEKDIKIEMLQAQLEEMKKERINNEPSYKYVDEPVENKKPTSIQTSTRIKKN